MLNTIVKTQLLLNDIREDIKGASLIEYSLLIGLISAAVVATIALVGPKVTAYWTTLNGNLP